MATITLDFSGIDLRVDELPAASMKLLREEWGPFVTAVEGEAFLRVGVSMFDRVIEPGPFEPHRMTSEFFPRGARFEMKEGDAEIEANGRGAIRLVAGQGRREFYTFLNLLRACLAWLLPTRGAAMVHAAGLVLDDRAFVLVGSEGAGKSTWAEFGEQAGGRVLSDDLVLVEQSGASFEVLGSPLRSTHETDYRPGRWPLAALLFPRRGSGASLEPCADLLARARVTANLPFISDALESDGRVGAVVDALVSKVDCMELTFGLDTTFVELLRSR